MSNSNFCKNCGARLTRKGWGLWLRGALCDDCATRPGVNSRSRTLIAVGLFAAAAFGFGRYMRPSPPPLIIQRAANSPLSDSPLNLNGTPKDTSANFTNTNSAVDDPVYTCGARTKKGTPCRRRVHFAGERCYQHKGRAAIVPLDKLARSDAQKK